MSSTNRSNARQSHISDYYITPVADILKFKSEILKYEPNIFKGIILDPCAGGDKNNPMSYPKALEEYRVYTIDIREDSLAEKKTDYLQANLKKNPNCIITNPPFNIAIDIIKKALNDVADGGYVIMLLRLNFFGSKSRFEFWQENMPKYTFVHSKRLSFTEGGKTDSIEYMHCVWQKGYNPEFTQLKVI